MKRQGFKLVMPNFYNNGEYMFRHPSKFGPTNAPDDRMALIKSAVEKEGMEFGLYVDALSVADESTFPMNHMNLVMREAIERYHPKALWFDWLGGDVPALDALFSAIKSPDPNIVIILNDSERPYNGDWDIITGVEQDAVETVVKIALE